MKDKSFQTKLKNKATYRQLTWNPVKYKDSEILNIKRWKSIYQVVSYYAKAVVLLSDKMDIMAKDTGRE